MDEIDRNHCIQYYPKLVPVEESYIALLPKEVEGKYCPRSHKEWTEQCNDECPRCRGECPNPKVFKSIHESSDQLSDEQYELVFERERERKEACDRLHKVEYIFNMYFSNKSKP